VRNIRKTLISIAFLLFFFSLISNVYAATPISSCVNITQPGEYYLTQDIIDSNATTCIIINSDNVQLDCRGYSIIAYNPSDFNFYYETAIYVNGSYISILNCNIGAYEHFGWTYGIRVYDGHTDINISYIYMDFIGYGMEVRYGSNVRITNGYFRGVPLYIYDVFSSYIYNLTIDGLGGSIPCIELWGVTNTIVSNLVITRCYYGISLQYGTENCQIVNNTIYNVNIAFADWTYGYTSNFIYNNIINVTNKYFYGSGFIEYWNTTLQPGYNIWNSSLGYIGGNLWTNSNGNGYSDTCVDANFDGFCDQPYDLLGDGTNIDYLPIAKRVGQNVISFSVVFNYNSVDFGIVTPNTIAEAKSINYNVSVTSASDYKVSVNATDWSGAITIPANTIYFAVNDTLDKLSFATAKQLSNAVQQVAIFPSTVTTNYHAFYFAVPVVPIGTYTATITITYEVV